jgi:hypothetical protein
VDVEAEVAEMIKATEVAVAVAVAENPDVVEEAPTHVEEKGL